MKKKVLVSWSTGKDSAWMLHILRRDTSVEVAGLFCSVNREFDRTAMHAVRKELLQKQAQAAGLPLEIVHLPWPCSNEIYEKIMADFIDKARERGISHVAFGDLFLQDIRDYRCAQFDGSGIEPLFPLWKKPTASLAREMLAGGLQAVVTCIDPRKMPEHLAGHRYDETFLEKLPEHVDPCGENGEFHTFVYSGPMFRHSIAIRIGETVTRDGFVFTDVLPDTPS